MQRSTLCKLGLLKTCQTLSINSDCYTAKFIISVTSVIMEEVDNNMGKLWHKEAESLLLLNEEESKYIIKNICRMIQAEVETVCSDRVDSTD